MIGRVLKKSSKLPAIFISNPTRKQLFIADVDRFFYSINIRDKQYQQFRQNLNDLPYSNLKKWKMFIDFALLFHFTGMEAEEYMKDGGDTYSSLHQMFKYTGSRWRQNIFQFSVNKKPENSEIRKALDDKESFNKRFFDLLSRDWITTDKSDKEIEDFIHKYQNVIVKPLKGSGGKGIFKLSYNDYAKTEKSIFNEGKYIIEQMLEQKGFLNQVNPSSVNTVRINTLYQNGKSDLLTVSLRTGREGCITDNFHSGGILWQIDPKSGEIKFGADAKGVFYETHPDSKIRMAGKKIPRFEEAIKLCFDAQNRTTELPQIGWDVVISDDYIALIEGNSGSGLANYDGTIPVWPIMKSYLIDNNVMINARNWN